MPFVSDYNAPSKVPKTAYWFLFHDQRLLIEDKHCRIPQSQDLEKLALMPTQGQFMGYLNGQPCFAAELDKTLQDAHAFTFVGLRTLFARFEEDMIWAAGMANQLVHWNQNHQYCGKCGNATEEKTDERARICPKCGLINYPRLSPAIIVAVVKGRQILLARPKRAQAAFYSVLAGFVEPGETLEACVTREVREETGISVQNIRYFGSQPWPFPDSFMIAFTAEYAEGEIRVDDSEIEDAAWFTADKLPSVPPKISIARELIDWFINNQKR